MGAIGELTLEQLETAYLYLTDENKRIDELFNIAFSEEDALIHN